MEELNVTKYWMALVLGVMALYAVVGFIGMAIKAKREKRDSEQG